MQTVWTIEELEAQIGALPAPRLAVVGNPIAHSLSPDMQLAAMRAAYVGGSYVRLSCPKEEGAFREHVERLRGLGFLGVNVTVPFKREARVVANEVDRLSELSGATNTLVFRGGKIEGFNTDGPGFEHALEVHCGRKLADERVLIIGACGGAGSALAMPCALTGCRRLVLANRPRPELEQLAARLCDIAPRLDIATCSMLDDEKMRMAVQDVDIIVNATSLGLAAGDPLPIATEMLCAEHVVFDLITHLTPLQQAATAKCRVCDGRDMLVGQGALSFKKWFGKEADEKAMRTAVADGACRCTMYDVRCTICK